MEKTTTYLAHLLILFLLIGNISCKNNISSDDEDDLEETLKPIEEVELISGGEDATITVNLNNEDAYFKIDYDNIQSNDIIENGTYNAWCIDVWKPIDHDGGRYSNIELYSTYRVESWKPVNYLFHIKEDLQNKDPDLTWREFQLVIWELRANPEFNLDETDIEELPGQMHDNGEPRFNPQKVKELQNVVEEGHEDFDYADAKRFAVIAETPPDSQTVITIVDL